MTTQTQVRSTEEALSIEDTSARSALKLALEALKSSNKLINGTGTKFGLEGAMDGYYSGCFDVEGNNKLLNKAITAIKEALAQEKALQALHDENERLGLYKEAYAQPEYQSTADKSKLEKVPVKGTLLAQLEHSAPHGEPVGFAVMQKPWVGMTVEEINEVLGGDIHDEPNGLLEFVRAIEAKLKEKNFS